MPVLLLVIALGYRLAHLAELRETVYHEQLLLDADRYDSVAKDLVKGNGFEEKVFTMTPVYPVFLFLSYSVFGRNLLLIRLIQGLIGALSCFLIYRISLKWFGARSALFSGLMAASYGPFIFYDNILMVASLSVLSVLGSLLMIDLAGESKKPLHWMAAGIVMGVNAAIRPNGLLLVPVALWWLFRCLDEKKQRAAAMLLVGILLPLIPVTARNLLIGGDPVLITASGGMNFYIGNHSRATGTFVPPASKSGHPTDLMKFAQAHAEAQTGRPMKPSEISRYWFSEAFDFIVHHPIRWIQLLLRKCWLLFNSMELPSSYDFHFARQHLNMLRFPIAGLGLILPLAVIGGVFAGINRRNKTLLLLGFLAALSLSLILFFILAHYRLPIIALLLPLAGYGLEALIEQVTARKWKSLGLSVSCFAAGLIITLIPPEDRITYDSQAHFNLGSLYQRVNDHVRASEEFSHAVRLMPKDGLARTHMGMELVLSGKECEGFLELKKAVEIDPKEPEAYNNLGIYYGNSGHPSRAAELFRVAITLDPEFEEARQNLRDALERLEEKKDAE